MGKPRFELSRVPNASVTDNDLLEDLQRVAAKLQRDTVPRPKYRDFGTYSHTTVSRRFGTWNKALKAAGLRISNEIMISDDRLFENILSLWQRLGGQPRQSALASEFSEFSEGPYIRRFGSWGAALKAFVEYANASSDEDSDPSDQSRSISERQPQRFPSLSLRYKVLLRDQFKCCLCGASPATSAGVNLHIDHIQPWSKGGETTLENLRTTCAPCNLGKGNHFSVGGGAGSQPNSSHPPER